jgi:hypothetical protein
MMQPPRARFGASLLAGVRVWRSGQRADDISADTGDETARVGRRPAVPAGSARLGQLGRGTCHHGARNVSGQGAQVDSKCASSAGAGPGIALPMQLMDGLRTGRVLHVTLDDDDDVIGVDAVLVGLTRIGFSPNAVNFGVVAGQCVLR